MMIDDDLRVAANRLADLLDLGGATATSRTVDCTDALRALVAEGYISILPRQPPLLDPTPTMNVPTYASRIVGLINELTGRRFKVGDQDKIRAGALVRAKIPLSTMLAMVEYMHGLWSKDPKMVEYIQPSTLMRLAKARDYIAKMEAGPARTRGDASGFRPFGND